MLQLLYVCPSDCIRPLYGVRYGLFYGVRYGPLYVCHPDGIRPRYGVRTGVLCKGESGYKRCRADGSRQDDKRRVDRSVHRRAVRSIVSRQIPSG